VGALARVVNLGERLEGEAGKMYEKYFKPRWKTNPLFINAAQALEILYAFERIPKVVDEMLKLPDPPLVKYTVKNGKGTGIVEAPRGLLIHSYEISKGLVSSADIITPTAQNAEDIERYCYIAAQKLLGAGKESQIRDRMDLVVRAYDPCFSCSVHMAEVKKAPADDWKRKLAQATRKSSPVFIGMGRENRSDDGAGLQLALELRRRGKDDVWLESEIEGELWKSGNDKTLIFLDALDFREVPGKVALVPLHFVLSNSSLSHRIAPLLSLEMDSKQLRNSYILGIQPESLKEGGEISRSVHKAINQVLDLILNG
jgi:sulfhydrogenase subunit alpha